MQIGEARQLRDVKQLRLGPLSNLQRNIFLTGAAKHLSVIMKKVFALYGTGDVPAYRSVPASEEVFHSSQQTYYAQYLLDIGGMADIFLAKTGFSSQLVVVKKLNEKSMQKPV